ncbi:MAG: hypothetical protein JNL83_37295 [Myxococcales bacterium]|nr:hypothetical protein [Myxococcales bacterium]
MRRPPALLVLAITLAGLPAAAHVAPSVDDNNRYLKITPGADRVRIAYTVFFGEVPGAKLRPSIDANRDGQISDDEAQAFGKKLSSEVAGALELTLDGATQPVVWTTVATGMGAPQVAAGSFSVDLIAFPCLASARGKHTLLLRDRFRVPNPGETEVRVEDGLGTRIGHTRIGAAADPAHDYKFVGPGGPLMDDGIEVAFAAADDAPLVGDGLCTGATDASGKKRIPRPLILGIAIALAAVLAYVVHRKQRGS